MTEPFPSISPPGVLERTASSTSVTRRPRKTSSLGADPRGDTGASALATSNLYHDNLTPPASPTDDDPASKALLGGSSSQTASSRPRRKKPRTLFQKWKRMSLKHTWVNPLAIVLAILGAYFINPGEQNPLHAAIFISYPDPPMYQRTTNLPAHIGPVTQYGKGPKDFAFVAFYTIVLSFSREFLMQRVIRPIALACGMRSRGKQSRFMEQFYTAVYFGISGPAGMYVMSRTPVWYLNTVGMYEGFPHRAHEAYFKLYYLLQAAYWAQQALVLMLQLEKPRKDFKELVLHHIITLSLIYLSYAFHFTYMGITIFITHDISDFFLATSKLMNYMDWAITGPFFVLFIFVWGYLRHFVNLTVLWSMRPGGEFQTIGPYELNWETQQYKCLLAQTVTFGLIASLQAINIFWFFLILRILYRYVFQGVQKDERSDDEDAEDLDERDESEVDDAKVVPTVTLNGQPVVVGVTGVEKGGAAVRRR